MKAFVPIIAMSALFASTVSGWSGSPSTGDLQVKMKIDKQCQVNLGGDPTIDFGTTGIVINDPLDSTASIKVLCTKGVSYSIGLDGGRNAMGARKYPIYGRCMRSGENCIQYHLYSSSNHNPTDIWGNEKENEIEGGTKKLSIVSREADGAWFSHTVYGRIFPSQNKDLAARPVGTYTDTVTVMVNF